MPLPSTTLFVESCSRFASAFDNSLSNFFTSYFFAGDFWLLTTCTACAISAHISSQYDAISSFLSSPVRSNPSVSSHAFVNCSLSASTKSSTANFSSKKTDASFLTASTPLSYHSGLGRLFSKSLPGLPHAVTTAASLLPKLVWSATAPSTNLSISGSDISRAVDFPFFSAICFFSVAIFVSVAASSVLWSPIKSSMMSSMSFQLIPLMAFASPGDDISSQMSSSPQMVTDSPTRPLMLEGSRLRMALLPHRSNNPNTPNCRTPITDSFLKHTNSTSLILEHNNTSSNV